METDIPGVPTKHSATAKAHRPGLLHGLSIRYRVRRARHQRLAWIPYTLTAVNLIVLAFLIFDEPLGQAARNLPAPLVMVAGTVTDAGRLISIIVAIATVSAVCLLVASRLTNARRRHNIRYIRRITAYVALSVLSASAAVHILKYAIGRARPLLYEQYGIFDFEPFKGGFLYQSFPSAHSAHVGAFFTALALLFPRFRPVFIGLGLWLGATRIIIGVHYPSDVMAGLALGCWFALATAAIFSRFGLIFSLGPDGWPITRADSMRDRK